MTIHGRVDGRISLPDHDLNIATAAVITARITARCASVAGSVDGNILAGERIHLLPGASVLGHLTTASIVLDDGAHFTGSVDPDRNETAMRVAKYRERQGS